MVKAATGVRAMLTSASNKICKKVFDAKQGNDCLLNVLANTDDEIVLRGAVMVQDLVNSCKETAEAVLETQVMEVLQALVLKANLDCGTAVPSTVQQQVMMVAEASLAEAHKHGIVRTQREAAVAEETEELELDPWRRAPAAPPAGRIEEVQEEG